MEKIEYTVTNPQTGEQITKKMDDTPENRSLLDKLIKERGLILESISPLSQEVTAETVGTEAATTLETATSPKGAFLGGLFSGATVEGKEELTRLAGFEEQARKLELERQKQETERPGYFGAGKFLGGLIPTIGATTLGAAAGGALGGPPGAIAGGMLGAGLAGTAESALEKTQAQRAEEGMLTGEDIGMGLISGLTEGIGRATAPYIRGSKKKILQKITAKPISKLSAKENEFIDAINSLRKEEAKTAELQLRVKAGQIGGQQAMSRAKEIKILKDTIDRLQEELVKSPEYSAISGAAASGVQMIGEEQVMTPEQEEEYEKLIIQEALRRQQRKQLKPLSDEELADIYF